jgi:hypothetical protein
LADKRETDRLGTGATHTHTHTHTHMCCSPTHIFEVGRDLLRLLDDLVVDGVHPLGHPGRHVPLPLQVHAHDSLSARQNLAAE